MDQRRLAAILVADVAGYSAMMAADEDGTLAAFRAHRVAIEPVILNHGGRIVKGTGDGVLVEFVSASSAVQAALELQDVMLARNAAVPEARRMEFRVGVNLGDVVGDESGDVFGTDVNVAARIEALAPAGGVVVTDAVHRAVQGKVDIAFTDAGERELRNIPRSVRIWSTGALAGKPAKVPERRSVATVAVLPFDNLGGDPDQTYFADGIAEDLLTALAHDSELGVVSRNSSFAYRGTPMDVRTVARELDVTHVVEGSVRRSGSQVRVTAQLIDAETGQHVWAERYDRGLEDVFALQDELVEAITTKLRPTLLHEAGERRARRDPGSLDAWDLTIRGRYEMNKHTVDGFLASIDLFDRACQLEPAFAPAHAGAASAWALLALWGWREEGVNPFERAVTAAMQAHAAAADERLALAVLAMASLLLGTPDEGIRHARRLIELNPLAFDGYHVLGANLAVAGDWEPSVDASSEAWRLAQHEPMRYDTANDLAYAHYMLGNYEAAVSWGRQSLDVNPGYLQAHLALAAAYAQSGRPADAQPHVDVVLETRPHFSCAKHWSRLLYLRSEDRDHIVEGLSMAGLPE